MCGPFACCRGRAQQNLLGAPIHAPFNAYANGPSKPIAPRAVPMTGVPAQTQPVATPDERRVGVNAV